MYRVFIEIKGEQKKTSQSFFYNNSVKFYTNSKILDIFELECLVTFGTLYGCVGSHGAVYPRNTGGW